MNTNSKIISQQTNQQLRTMTEKGIYDPEEMVNEMRPLVEEIMQWGNMEHLGFAVRLTLDNIANTGHRQKGFAIGRYAKMGRQLLDIARQSEDEINMNNYNQTMTRREEAASQIAFYHGLEQAFASAFERYTGDTWKPYAGQQVKQSRKEVTSLRASLEAEMAELGIATDDPAKPEMERKENRTSIDNEPAENAA